MLRSTSLCPVDPQHNCLISRYCSNTCTHGCAQGQQTHTRTHSVDKIGFFFLYDFIKVELTFCFLVARRNGSVRWELMRTLWSRLHHTWSDYNYQIPASYLDSTGEYQSCCRYLWGRFWLDTIIHYITNVFFRISVSHFQREVVVKDSPKLWTHSATPSCLSLNSLWNASRCHFLCMCFVFVIMWPNLHFSCKLNFSLIMRLNVHAAWLRSVWHGDTSHGRHTVCVPSASCSVHTAVLEVVRSS